MTSISQPAASITDTKSSSLVAATVAAVAPRRVWIQRFDTVSPDYQLVADALTSRGIPFTYKTTEDLVFRPTEWHVTRDDVVVGNFDWTRMACERLRVPLPQPPDYPQCLKHLLHRRIWQSTLGDVQKWLAAPENKSSLIFIKPAESAKVFAAIVEPRDQMIDTLLSGMEDVMDGLPRTTAVHCSDVIDMVSEYRVYVVHGVIRAICQYRGTPSPVTITRPATATAATTASPVVLAATTAATASSSLPQLDMAVVTDAVRKLCSCDEGRDIATGCSIDFAVAKRATTSAASSSSSSSSSSSPYFTCLVEVNDGYSLGRYDGLTGNDYTDLLIARWQRLMSTPVRA